MDPAPQPPYRDKLFESTTRILEIAKYLGPSEVIDTISLEYGVLGISVEIGQYLVQYTLEMRRIPGHDEEIRCKCARSDVEFVVYSAGGKISS
jgi:hypothetical protein